MMRNKVKLATAIIGISSIPLRKTFVNASTYVAREERRARMT
jgi:uncharacterized membrane protein YqhA